MLPVVGVSESFLIDGAIGGPCISILAHGPLTIGVWSSEESERNTVEEHETGEQDEICTPCEYMQHEIHDFGTASISMSA